jgi:hypothetical protein
MCPKPAAHQQDLNAESFERKKLSKALQGFFSRKTDSKQLTLRTMICIG